MLVKVHFRYNPTTGEVETFEIDDQASTLPEDEHNREHDRIAAEIGNLIERNPRITEVLPGAAPVQTVETAEEKDEGQRTKDEGPLTTDH